MEKTWNAKLMDSPLIYLGLSLATKICPETKPEPDPINRLIPKAAVSYTHLDVYKRQ